jgi:hypothetical protein
LKKRKSIVKISELPARTKLLSTEEITDLFGGCRTENSGNCFNPYSMNPDDCMCCPGYYCYSYGVDVYTKGGTPAGQKTYSYCKPR